MKYRSGPDRHVRPSSARRHNCQRPGKPGFWDTTWQQHPGYTDIRETPSAAACEPRIGEWTGGRAHRRRPLAPTTWAPPGPGDAERPCRLSQTRERSFRMSSNEGSGYSVPFVLTGHVPKFTAGCLPVPMKSPLKATKQCTSLRLVTAHSIQPTKRIDMGRS